MRGDFTRSTFEKTKHFSGVRMQQGRVQIDADWNEQIDIAAHRIETETVDTAGPCAVPLHAAGFALQPKDNNLLIRAGRAYVDGILCENEQDVLATNQPDLPANAPIVKLMNDEVVALSAAAGGVYVAYLDVWSRHLTALEEPQIREVALGGPDTATRTKTIWQVKLLGVGNIGTAINCLSSLPTWNALVAPPSARLRARTKAEEPSDKPCIVAPGAGYRRLENQLYRVEIHKSGPLGTATFKWSRDNGSIVAKWEAQSGNELTVSSMGRDKVLGFASGQWVELTDDARELLGKPGTLVRIVKAEGSILTIDPGAPVVNKADFSLNPKVRRWDSIGEVEVKIPGTNDGWIPLEDGVEVHFQLGAIYQTGQHWLIPARTAKGDIEWPKDNAQNPLALPPHGIEHHCCRLAVLQFDGADWTQLSDCRELFPPLTELTSLFYVSGDGQEVLPDPAAPEALLPLPKPLKVGVADGQWPVAAALVRFQSDEGNGRLKPIFDTPPNLIVKQTDHEVIVRTALDGIAGCDWELNSTTLSQQVKATLLDVASQPIHLPIIFTANLSVASQVAYDPKHCAGLKASSVKTVQAAIDRLCGMERSGCSVTVGREGKYRTVENAIGALLKENKTDLCICLLPGSHELFSLEMAIGSDRHLKISGCGPATRVSLKRPIMVKDLASFTLKELEIEAGPLTNPLWLDGCKLVTVEGCHIYGIPESGALLTIEAAERVRLEDNRIEAYLQASIDTSAKFFEGFPLKLAELFAATGRKTFDSMTLEAAETIAAMDARLRALLDEQLKVAKARDNLTVAERESYTALADTFSAANVRPEFLSAGFKKVRDVAAHAFPGMAVVIMEGNVDARFEGNEIIGLLCLSGVPGESKLNGDELQKFGRLLRESAVTFSRIAGDLRIQSNRVTRVTLGGDAVGEIKALIDANGGKLDNACRRGFISDNVIESGENLVLAQQLAFTSNTFAMASGENAGTVIANSAIFSGNQAPDDKIKLFQASRRNQKASNLLTIVDL